MYTYWDEELGSHLLTEEGKKLTERDMINVIGDLESKLNNQEMTVEDTNTSESTWDPLKPFQTFKHTCGSCKYEYLPEDVYPCNTCVYGTDNRQDLWEEKEND